MAEEPERTEEMTSEPANGGDFQWLLDPPAPGEARVHLAVGAGTELTSAVREALDHLIDTLRGQDVQGHLLAGSCYPRCGDLADCGRFTCNPLRNCVPLTQMPCLADMNCLIRPTPRPLP